MRFAWPLALLGLLLVPLALYGYRLLERRRATQAAAFANPLLVPNLVRNPPGRLRHLPPVLALVALAALVTGLARPHAQVSVPREEATVVLALDTSRSMVATDVTPTRLAAAQKAVRVFLEKLPERYRVSLVSFADGATVVSAPTANRKVTEAALAALRPGDGTALGDGLARAVQVAQRVRGEDGQPPPATIVVLSDGAQTQGQLRPLTAAQRAKKAKIPVNAVSLGTPQGVVDVIGPDGFRQRVTVPPDPGTLRRITNATGGRFYSAPDGERLEAVYRELGSRIGRKKEDREITSAFAAAGALLLLGSAAASALLFGRVP